MTDTGIADLERRVIEASIRYVQAIHSFENHGESQDAAAPTTDKLRAWDTEHRKQGAAVQTALNQLRAQTHDLIATREREEERWTTNTSDAD